MKKLDLSKPDNLSFPKAFGRVCEGLARYCEILVERKAKEPFTYRERRELKEMASEFSAYGRFWLRQGMINDAKKSKIAKDNAKLFKLNERLKRRENMLSSFTNKTAKESE